MRSFVAIAALVLAIAGSTILYTARADDNDTPAVTELEQTFLLPDGRIATIHILVDTREVDPEKVLADLIARTPGEPMSDGVQAAYLLLRKWHPADVPVPFTYNPEFDPLGVDGEAAALWAASAWSNVPAQDFAFTYAGITDTFYAFCDVSQTDGENTIRFSYLLDAGVLGETCSITSGSTGGHARAAEFDMVLDGWTDWSTASTTPSDSFDLYSVVLHELGHALGLGHTSASNAVMSAFLDFGEQFRTFTADDLTGLRALYGTVAAPSPTSTSTNAPTQAATAAPTSPATPGPSRGPYRAYVGGVFRGGLTGGAAGPSPSAVPPTAVPPTMTITPPTTAPPTSVPATMTPTSTPPPTYVSQRSDGDEAIMLFNDIQSASLTSSQSGVRVSLTSWYGNFSYYDNDLGDDSYLALQVYFGSTSIGDEDLFVFVAGDGLTVYRTTGSDFTLVHSAASPGTSSPLTFSLPASLFSGHSQLKWRAIGAEARFSPDCSGSSCSWYDYDWVPEVLEALPTLQLP